MALFTIAQVEARIITLRNARDSGVLLVRHGDTSTQFRSLKELNEILADLEAWLAAQAGVPRRNRVSYVSQSDKGF